MANSACKTSNGLNEEKTAPETTADNQCLRTPYEHTKRISSSSKRTAIEIDSMVDFQRAKSWRQFTDDTVCNKHDAFDTDSLKNAYILLQRMSVLTDAGLRPGADQRPAAEILSLR